MVPDKYDYRENPGDLKYDIKGMHDQLKNIDPLLKLGAWIMNQACMYIYVYISSETCDYLCVGYLAISKISETTRLCVWSSLFIYFSLILIIYVILVVLH